MSPILIILICQLLQMQSALTYAVELKVDVLQVFKNITKSYRKQALKCHPDKNPGNPRAAEQFHMLTYALEVLTDFAVKAAYDKIWKARKAADRRKNQYDSTRKKFKDDLDAREKAALEPKENSADAAKKLQAEAKWKIEKDGQTKDEGYTKEELKNMFEQKHALENIKGKSDFLLILTWLSGQPPDDYASSNSNDRTTSSTATGTKFPSFSEPTFGGPTMVHNRNFESIVLMKMRQAEERRKLIEQMMKEDEGGS